MPATLVVPTKDDLDAMRGRTLARLTPDGAQSWYVNDVSRLLDEVSRLRTLMRAAKDSFTTDIDGWSLDDDTPLPEIAEHWKETATGVYEKAVVKKLRDDLKLVRQERDLYKQAASDEAIEHAQTRSDLDAAKQDIVLLHDSLYVLQESKNIELQAEQAEQVSLREKILELEHALVDCSERCERVVAIANAQAAHQREEALELLTRAAEILGDH